MNRIFILMLVALFLSAASGCRNKNNNQDADAMDTQTAMVVYLAFSEVLAQIEYVPNNLKGNIKVTINSPHGGHVDVTGTATFDEETQKIHWQLTVGWKHYVYKLGNTDLAFNGTMTYAGNATATNMTARFVTYPRITVSGTINGTAVNSEITFNFMVWVSNNHGSIEGEINGRSFSVSF
ncbi:MAG: hypothetical protein ISR57_01935 [Bacteroidales bacterium]|nr:hypothetical protein [Bacteroidales bacterium]